jgi:hypothetical protein
MTLGWWDDGLVRRILANRVLVFCAWGSAISLTSAPNDHGGRLMSKAARTTDIGPVPLPRTTKPRTADNDVLHFLTRTLQAHCLDAEPQDVLEKLQNLQKALDQQQATLLNWPDSPSKDRICEALTKAKTVVAQVVDKFAATTKQLTARNAKAV